MAGDTIINITGNLASDPELRFTSSGAAVCSFTVASTPRSFDKASNEWKDGETLWMRCTAWRIMAENVAELPKGTRVMVEGRLVQRSFETKEGEKRTVIEVQAEEVGASLKFAGVKVLRPERGGGTQRPEQRQRQQQPASDPWATAPATDGGFGGGFASEPPF
jgi:single-strand DNA-binding protein